MNIEKVFPKEALSYFPPIRNCLLTSKGPDRMVKIADFGDFLLIKHFFIFVMNLVIKMIGEADS